MLVVLERGDEVSARSRVRNIPTVHVLVADQLNAYDVLVSDDIVFTKAALDAFVAGPKADEGRKEVSRNEHATTRTRATSSSRRSSPRRATA